ncbi:MAG: epoxyqueuosine reductase QueH [Desulfatibacillaceae bacterium]|nr:epoxyqueuosine reductase QueH [Desulfatibacillaceae bacterium]
MKILVHTCCGPCSVYPVPRLLNVGHEVICYFHRANIHPWAECQRREETLLAWAKAQNLVVIVQPGYKVEDFFQKAAFREQDRCIACYHERLYAAASLARRAKADAFTTTLLYSKFQKHELIAQIGNAVGRQAGVEFYYEDFRLGWKQGIEESKQLKMYRQQYCGCLYSEKERYKSEIDSAQKS